MIMSYLRVAGLNGDGKPDLVLRTRAKVLAYLAAADDTLLPPIETGISTRAAVYCRVSTPRQPGSKSAPLTSCHFSRRTQ
jgi:hypothetical protein